MTLPKEESTKIFGVLVGLLHEHLIKNQNAIEVVINNHFIEIPTPGGWHEHKPTDGLDITIRVRPQKKLAQRQLTRDDIIKMAKRDVAELTYTAEYTAVYFRKFNGVFPSVKFILNRDKRTVVALLKPKYTHVGNRVLARGIAKCHPDDCFNVHIGKAIALRRALGLEVPDEYLNAPQPTEVRVGDVVKSKKNPNPRYRVINEYNGLIDVEELKCGIPYKECTIEIFYTIDDSREEV
jgi:hypothetical protein